jgi:L-threonylcarbamoyladenylate synthase
MCNRERVNGIPAMGNPDIWQVDDTTETALFRRCVDAAARHLGAGRLVILPTETVYGLAADATDPRAAAGIFAAKGRPEFNPLIAHVADPEMAAEHGVFDDVANRLAEAFWPGPLTLVMPRQAHSPICDAVTAGLDTVALRMPAPRIMRAVAAELGHPIAAPSANRSGRVSPTTAAAAEEELGAHVAMIVDSGPCLVGVESTIVSCTGGAPRLLRPGGVPRETIEQLLGIGLGAAAGATEQPEAPGMLESHYAPAALVRLEADTVSPGEALLAFGPEPATGWQGARAVLNLSVDGDLAEAAANLFAHLRALDASGARVIAVMPVPSAGLGEAINDRLRRAAARRDKPNETTSGRAG